VAKKKRFFLKINGDTMTTIVVVSLIVCVIFVVTGFWFAWNDKDVSAIVGSALLCFGTELGICGLMKIFDRNNAIRDKELEENKRRAEARKERRGNNG
jgi:hypothetical protein